MNTIALIAALCLGQAQKPDLPPTPSKDWKEDRLAFVEKYKFEPIDGLMVQEAKRPDGKIEPTTIITDTYPPVLLCRKAEKGVLKGLMKPLRLEDVEIVEHSAGGPVVMYALALKLQLKDGTESVHIVRGLEVTAAEAAFSFALNTDQQVQRYKLLGVLARRQKK